VHAINFAHFNQFAIFAVKHYFPAILAQSLNTTLSKGYLRKHEQKVGGLGGIENIQVEAPVPRPNRVNRAGRKELHR